MVFVCPECCQAYSLGQCHIPATAGTRATVICVCKTAIEIFINQVSRPWWRLFGKDKLEVMVKRRG